MKRERDKELAESIKNKLFEYSTTKQPLPGIEEPQIMSCFVQQIIDSVRRIKYVTSLREREIGHLTSDPHSEAFNPIKSAIWHFRRGDINEAFWLVFLITHFGKNKKTNWGLLKAVYGNLGEEELWDWERVSSDPEGFGQWINDNETELKSAGNFGNHRKYESLKSTGTGAAIISYVEWVGEDLDHLKKIEDLFEEDDNARERFNKIYSSLNRVYRFGRTGTFDYLTMVGKLGFTAIEPGSVFMQGATGPYQGACLLLAGDETAGLNRNSVNDFLADLETYLELPFGMQVLEDAICNWQKSPSEYEYFNG